jgi:hypothetical protein
VDGDAFARDQLGEGVGLRSMRSAQSRSSSIRRLPGMRRLNSASAGPCQRIDSSWNTTKSSAWREADDDLAQLAPFMMGAETRRHHTRA